MHHSGFFKEANLQNTSYSAFFDRLARMYFEDRLKNGFFEYLIWRTISYIKTRASLEDDSNGNEKNNFLDYVGSNLAYYLSPWFKEDHELITHYLKKKVNKEELPVNKIAEVNIYDYNPEQLAEKYEPWGNEWYYFTPTERKYPNGERPKRSAGKGYWKATGADKGIKVEKEIVGFKKVLVFYQGKPPQGAKTNWIMHEYRIAQPPPLERRDEHDKRLDECVLCKIYKKVDKRRQKRPRDAEEEEEEEEEKEKRGGSESKISKLASHDQEDDANSNHLQNQIQQLNIINVQPFQNPITDSQPFQNPINSDHQPFQNPITHIQSFQNPIIDSQSFQNPITNSQPFQNAINDRRSSQNPIFQNPNTNCQPLQNPIMPQPLHISANQLPQYRIQRSNFINNPNEIIESLTQQQQAIINVHGRPVIHNQPQFQSQAFQTQMQQPSSSSIQISQNWIPDHSHFLPPNTNTNTNQQWNFSSGGLQDFDYLK